MLFLLLCFTERDRKLSNFLTMEALALPVQEDLLQNGSEITTC